jgi:4-hydroxyphenylacetate 3-monooxygenase
VKLDFITGLLIKATEITGARAFRGVEANIGEVIAWRNMIWGLSDAMAKTADPWTGGCILPGMEPAAAYQVLAPEAYVQIKNLIEKTVASGLIYLNSHARDFETPEMRKYLDLYLRGSGGVDAVGRVKLMKLLWDAVGTEFGGRHELYEINYSGSHEEIRRYALFGALASGQYDRWKQFAESCMAEIRPRWLEGQGPCRHQQDLRSPLSSTSGRSGARWAASPPVSSCSRWGRDETRTP